MWILFDLDDTLVETSKCLTPYALERAYHSMGSIGTLDELIELNQKSLTSKEAVECFWSRHSQDKEKLHLGLSVLSAPLEEKTSLDPVPGAVELLDELYGQFPLVLVTRGIESLQREKMKKAGIQPDRFSKLIIGCMEGKRSAYEMAARELNLPPTEAIVCGDRVPLDLSPGRVLGMTTVHFLNGRGVHHREPRGDVDHTIQSIQELTKVFHKHEV